MVYYYYYNFFCMSMQLSAENYIFVVYSLAAIFILFPACEIPPSLLLQGRGGYRGRLCSSLRVWPRDPSLERGSALRYFHDDIWWTLLLHLY